MVYMQLYTNYVSLQRGGNKGEICGNGQKCCRTFLTKHRKMNKKENAPNMPCPRRDPRGGGGGSVSFLREPPVFQPLKLPKWYMIPLPGHKKELGNRTGVECLHQFNISSDPPKTEERAGVLWTGPQCKLLVHSVLCVAYQEGNTSTVHPPQFFF